MAAATSTGFRRIPKRRLVLMVPEPVEAAIRDAANRTRKSRSEVGSVAIASSLGVAMPAPGDGDAAPCQ